MGHPAARGEARGRGMGELLCSSENRGLSPIIRPRYRFGLERSVMVIRHKTSTFLLPSEIVLYFSVQNHFLQTLQ